MPWTKAASGDPGRLQGTKRTAGTRWSGFRRRWTLLRSLARRGKKGEGRRDLLRAAATFLRSVDKSAEQSSGKSETVLPRSNSDGWLASWYDATPEPEEASNGGEAEA